MTVIRPLVVGFSVFAFTAAYALTIPPVAVLPARDASGVAVSRMRCRTWLYDHVGFWLQTSATTPLTNGVAIEVPE